MSRGQFDLGRKAIYMVVVVFILIFIFFYFATLMNNYYANSVVNSDDISADIIATNLLVSPACLAFSDSLTSRVYLGVVDIVKFTQNLGSCLPYNDRPFRVRIDDRELNFGLKDDASTISIERLVLVRNGTGEYPAIMAVEVGYVR